LPSAAPVVIGGTVPVPALHVPVPPAAVVVAPPPAAVVVAPAAAVVAAPAAVVAALAAVVAPPDELELLSLPQAAAVSPSAVNNESATAMRRR